MNRRLLPPLAVLAAALAGTIGWEALTAPATGPKTARPGPLAERAAAAPPWGVTPEEVAALLSRPPFSPSRRPDPAEGGAVAGLPVLSGILVTQVDRRAIFGGAGGGRSTVVEVGNQIGAYRVEAISPADVTLAGPDGRRTITPTFSAAAPPPRGAPGGLPAGFLPVPPPLPLPAPAR